MEEDHHDREQSTEARASVHAVIVHHRGREMLESCLASLLASLDIDLEIVVVANSCREALPDIVERASRVHLVVAENSLGFSAANNFGVAWAREHLGTPDYYYFVNNDTKSSPEALSRLVASLQADPDAALAGPLLLILGAPDRLNSLGLQITEDAWGWDEGIGQRLGEYGPLPDERPVLAITGSALLTEANTYLLIGGWTEVYDFYFEDIDLCIKVWESGHKVIHVPAAVVYHRISATMTEDSAGTERKHFLFWRNRLMLAWIHWPRGLLWRLLKRTLIEEIARRRWEDSALPRRAFVASLARLPVLLRLRWRLRRRHDWRRFLHPPGSVPVITLPHVNRADEEPEDREPDAARTAARPTVPRLTWDAARALEPGGAGRRVLVVGCSPLPFENERMNYAPGTRTWQLARPLARAGHAVCVACTRIPGAYGDEGADVREIHRDGAAVYTLPWELADTPCALPSLVEAFAPEVLVGATALASRRAVALAGDLPVWVDLFGDPMAEAQAKAAVDGRDDLTAYADLLWSLLGRGDAFSAVSDRQRFAVVGQLGLYGRLNRANHGLELVYTVPCASAASETREAAAPPDLEPGDFVVLWSGGFNTWCDVPTLFRALETAMEGRSDIRFVATGGPVEGHDEETYGRFVRLVEGSALRHRFLLKGRLPAAEADSYLARADLGIVTEKPIYERILGSSARVSRWLARGLPFVCAEVSELSRTIAEHHLGMTYPPGDSDALARCLLEAAADPDRLRGYREAARRFAGREWTFERSTRALCEWVARAARLPDHGFPEMRSRLASPARVADLERRHAEQMILHTRLEARAEELERTCHELREELDGIHRSKTWRWWMRYLALRKAILHPLRVFRR